MVDLGASLTAIDSLVEARLRAGEAVTFIVPSSSMRPVLRPGDAIVVRGASPGELRLGDVIVCRPGDGWRAHRLIGRKTEGAALLLVTKGDAAPRPDPPWPASRLRGVAVAVRHAGRERDLRSRRARWIGMFLARLSSIESKWHGTRPRRGRRIVRRALRVSMRIASGAASWMIGTCLAVALAAATPAGAAVTVSSFTAEGQATRIVLAWTTASEADNAGFNLLRSASEGGTYSRINASLLPSRCLGCIAGASYSADDTTVIIGQPYYYVLETVASDGATERFGPVSASAGGSSPTPIASPTSTPASSATPQSASPQSANVSPAPTASPMPGRHGASTVPAVTRTTPAAPSSTPDPTHTEAPRSAAPAGTITPLPSTAVPADPHTPPAVDAGTGTHPDVVYGGAPSEVPHRSATAHSSAETPSREHTVADAAEAQGAIRRVPGALRRLLAAAIVVAAALQALALLGLSRAWMRSRSIK